MPPPARDAALAKIRENIDAFGYHVYVVAGGCAPRFAYTIGLTPSLGVELVLAGGAIFSADEARGILEAARRQLAAQRGVDRVSAGAAGEFTLRAVHATWSAALLLGAMDYFTTTRIEAYQCVPDPEHTTIDVPDLSVARRGDTEPVWQWLTEPWPYAVPRSARAMTNLAALRGERVTEVARWEQDYWEMFAGAGPDVTEEEARSVPIATLLGADPSLAPALDLAIGAGIWRDERAGDWNPWHAGSDRDE